MPRSRKPSSRSPSAFYPRLIAADFALLVALFELQRLGLLISHYSDFGDAPSSALALSFLHGARLDEVVAGYLALPAALAALAAFVCGLRPTSAARGLRTLMGALFFVAAAAAWGELEFFGYFRDRYSYIAVEYFDTPVVVWAQIWGRYHPLWVLGGAAASTAAFVWALRRLAGPAPEAAPRLRAFPGLLAALAAVVLFIRGFGIIPTRWGAAYFSPYASANHLALNGLLTLATDVEYRLKDKFWIFFDKTMPEEEAVRIAASVIVGPGDRPTEAESEAFEREVSPGGPKLLRVEKPNIALVAMESFSTQVAGALGGPLASTPRFDELAEGGLLFPNYFSQGARTGRAIFSLVAGLPSPPGQSVMKTSSGRRSFPSLARQLKAQGYRTAFVYGGELSFDNMDSFLRQSGFDELVGIDDFPEGRLWELKTKWGVPDQYVFEKAAQLAARPGAPNFVFVMTLSNHPPFFIPEGFKKPFSGPMADERNAVAYADASLGGFADKLRQSGALDRTLLIVVGDHSQFYEGQAASEASHFHVPCLFYGPSVLVSKPGRVERVAGHADIAPTVLGLLGRPYKGAFWGRDVFRDPDGPSRLLLASSRSMWLIEDGLALRDEPYAEPAVYSFSDPAALTWVRAPSSDDPLLLKERALSEALRLVTGGRSDRP